MRALFRARVALIAFGAAGQPGGQGPDSDIVSWRSKAE
jgi:hypothetical protein